MKKLIITLNILSLFLTSCGSFTSTERAPAAQKDRTCQELIKDFFNDNNRPDKMAETLKSYVKLDLEKEEIKDFFKEFSDTNLSSKDDDMFKSIFLFSKGDSVTRQSLLKEFHNQLSGSGVDEENKIWKKFIGHKKKVDGQKKKIMSKGKTEVEKSAALKKAMNYEKLYYGCKSQIASTPSASDLNQAKRLTYALTAGGMGSTVVTYSTVHWDEEKNAKWYNELSFTLGMGMILSYVSGKFVLTNPNLHPWKGRMPLAFLYNAVSDVGVSALYAYLFGTGNNELEKRLQEIQADPASQEKLEQLLKIAEENHLFEKHLKNTQEMFKDKKTNQSMKASDFDHDVTFDDIDMEASRELLLAALAEQEYEESSGPLETGSKPVDRFTYHRLYNVISTPTNIGLAIIMKNQMCMATNPKQGFAKAVALYMGISILFDALYFKGRKELINQ